MTSDTLQKVLAYIDAHIQQKISLCELSELACYSPFYFSKLFSEAMGMPVTGYIRIRKLQHAVVALLEGQKVLDVALLYSFDSHEGFTRSFTQLFGSNPSTVRKFLTSYTVPGYIVPATQHGRIKMEPDDKMDLTNNMHQLIYEALKNPLEEAMEGFCSTIDVSLLPGNRARVTDNGRGIPLSENPCASKAVLEKIMAGCPITNAEYSQMGDLTLSGMQTVNSLCEALQITVTHDGRQYCQDYVRGIAQHELHVQGTVPGSGTSLLLKPDTAIFGSAAFSQETIEDWLKTASADIPQVQIKVHAAEE